MKDIVYRDNPLTLHELEDTICQTSASSSGDTLQRVTNNFILRLRHVSFSVAFDVIQTNGGKTVYSTIYRRKFLPKGSGFYIRFLRFLINISLVSGFHLSQFPSYLFSKCGVFRETPCISIYMH